MSLGMMVSIIIIGRCSKKIGENAEQVINLAFFSIVGGLIFSRLFHVIFYEPKLYLQNPIEILKVWNGGLSSFGGLFGAVIAFFIYAKKRSVNFLRTGDILAFAAVYGWMIGRIGCVMIHDHPGIKYNHYLAFQWIDGMPRFDMAFLEILTMIPLAILFFVKSKKNDFHGLFIVTLFIYYGIIRFILDFFRATDIIDADVRYFGLTPAQYFAIVLVISGLYILIKPKKLVRSRKDRIAV